MPLSENNLASVVIDRIKQVEGYRFDTDVSPILHVEKTMIGKWKARGTVPYEKLVEYSRTSGVSLDWLLNGRGPQRIEQMVDEGAGHYDAKPVIDSDLFVAIGKTIDQVLNETDADQDTEKRDRMVAIIYNDLVGKEGGQEVSQDKVKELAKLVG